MIRLIKITHGKNTDVKRSTKTMSIETAVRIAYSMMPNTFRGPDFCATVQRRMLYNGSCPMDGTILRRLREARANCPEFYNYTLLDPAKSIYKKGARNVKGKK